MANNPYVNKVVYGNTTVMDISDTTATASDVASGKYFYSASGQKVAGTASGGGGSAITVIDEVLPNGATAKHITAVDISSDTVDAAHLAQGYTAHAADGTALVGTMSGGGASNFVTGTFTGTTTGAAMDVNIPYTGNGYPIAAIIYPSEGSYNSSGTFYNLVQRYTVETYVSVKSYPLLDPWDTSLSNTERTLSAYTFRYKGSASSSLSRSASQGTSQNYTNTNATGSASNIVRLKSNTILSVFMADTSYGFAANISYTYYIIYSS